MRDVVTALVTALEGAGLSVYKAEAPQAAKPPYVVVHAARPGVSDRSVAAKHSAARWRVSTIYVGTSLDSVLWVAEKASEALKDQRLSISGLYCSPLIPESGRPVERDPDDQAVFSATDVWAFKTSPAPVPPPPPPPPEDEDEGDPPA